LLNGLSIGSKLVVVNLDGVGNSVQPFTSVLVEGIATVNSLTPNSGSIQGGTILKINGNGFSNIENTQVKIGNKSCIVKSVKNTEIVLLTPENLPGDLPVSIR
jgi:hypothetical protein